MEPNLLVEKKKDLIEILKNQNGYIDEVLKNIETGRFYFRYFVLKTQKTSLIDLPRKHNFNTSFFSLMNIVRQEFSVYKKLLQPLLADKLFLPDIAYLDKPYINRKLPYWSKNNLSSLYLNLFRNAQQNISVRKDFIFEEEAFFDGAELNKLTPERRNRILIVFRKVGNLFGAEMANRPIGGNILFHSTNFFNLKEIIKNAKISTKYEKIFLEEEIIPGGAKAGTAGISFNFNIGAHFWYSQGGTGGIFMLPMLKALKKDYVLIEGGDPFEILLVPKYGAYIQRIFLAYNNIKEELDINQRNCIALRAFYLDEDNVKSDFIDYIEKMDVVNFAKLFLKEHYGYSSDTSLLKLKEFCDKFKIWPTYHDFNEKIERELNKPENNEYYALFNRLMEQYKSELVKLKENFRKPFGEFFLIHKDIDNKLLKTNLFFRDYVGYINEEILRKKNLPSSQFSWTITDPDKKINEEQLNVWFTQVKVAELHYPISYILERYYQNREFKTLGVKEVAEIFEIYLPKLFQELKMKHLGHLETAIFIKDAILILPKSRFEFWEDFFNKLGNRPYITFYFDDKQDINTLQDRALTPFLRRCGIDFKPMFTDDYTFKKFMEHKYFEGTKYNFRGECRHYELKNIE